MRYLVRHDRPAVPAGLCYGASDPAPAVPAEQTARWLRPRLPAGLPVYSSPLRRCAELARALHPRPVVLEGLREVDYGDWEMRPWEEIRGVDEWAADPFGFAFPSGEAVPDFLARVTLTITGLPETATVITHGGVIRAALHDPGGLDRETAFARPVPFVSIHRL